jgi:hypothetical protein
MYMKSQTTTLTKPVIDLPKSWENTKIVVDFPDNATVVLKKLDAHQNTASYDSDEKKWSEIKNKARSIRGEVFKQFYPELYEREQKQKA